MIKMGSANDAGQAGPEGTDDVSAALAPLDRPVSQRNWPRAPAAAEWAVLSEAERACVVAELEAWLSSGALDFMAEGPTHLDKKYKSMEERDALRQQFLRERETRLRELTQALFAILAARGLVVPDEVRARILSCTEPALLLQWIPRAAVCATAEAIFAGQE